MSLHIKRLIGTGLLVSIGGAAPAALAQTAPMHLR